MVRFASFRRFEDSPRKLRGSEAHPTTPRGLQGPKNLLAGHARNLVLDGADRRWIPLEAHRLVDRDERVSHALAPADDDDAPHMGRAADEALAHPHQLGAPARVDTVLAGAVLACHFSDACVDAERAEGFGNDLRGLLEACADSGSGLRVRDAPGERNGVRVKHGGAPSCQTQDRTEACLPCGLHGLAEAGSRTIEDRERDDVAGGVETQCVRVPAIGHLFEERARQTGIEGGAVGERLFQQCDGAGHPPKIPGYRFVARHGGETMGPMEGIKVVEMGVWVAGPAAGVVLADWGADVVKIEPPGIGDPARLFQQMLGGDLPFNPPFEMDNRSKRSVVIDLATPEGKELGLELIDRADVFISNIRPAALERLGYGPDALLQRNPRLVYGLLTGYGLEGPEKDKAAYDIAGFWARSGIAHMLTQPGSPPPFQRGGMGDHGTGMVLAGAVSAALFSRERTGKGQLVSSSLIRQGIYTLAFDVATALRFGVGLAVGNRKAMGNPCINNYQDKAGRWFWIVGLEGARHWPPLCHATGHP